MTITSPDEDLAAAFVGKAVADLSATTTTLLATIGDRLGLFRSLAEHGPATSAELAARAGIVERYAREWLAAMAAAGYLTHDASDDRFALPSEHRPVLADETGPVFFGGFYQELAAMVGVLDRVADAFRSGGGVHQSAYSEDMWDGLERATGAWFEHLLVPVWLPAMPDVESKLRSGARVADVGCGRGRAVIKLACEYPTSSFVGYDAFGPTIAKAAANAAAAGVGDRVRFEHLDAAAGLPETFDVITTFDVVHDAVDPLGLLRAIRDGLAPGGAYVCVDINGDATVDGNAGPLGALFYGFSVFYCLTTSLAAGGAGLGTVGFHEHKVAELCAQAGFASVRKLPLENPFNNVYEIRP